MWSPQISLVAAIALSLGTTVSMTDWYVDKHAPNCAAGDGSQAAPFCSINDALAVVGPGDVVHVAPATYVENLAFWANTDVTVIGTAGAGVTIVDGNQAGSVAVILPFSTVVIDGLTLRNGVANYGGGIRSDGELTLLNTIVSGNTAQSNTGGFGGGIYSWGDLTLKNTEVIGNWSVGNTYCAGIAVGSGNATFVDSTIANNTSLFSTLSGAGVGIQSSARELTLTNCTVSDNSNVGLLGSYAAAIRTYLSYVSIDRTTISGNLMGDSGGAIMAEWSFAFVIRNSTISGNSGTGLLVHGNPPFRTSLFNVTIANNVSSAGAGGISNGLSVPVEVRNSIIAGNVGHGSANNDLDGAFISRGHNLIGDDTGGTGFVDGANGDIVGTMGAPVSPVLAPLSNNGGRTQTHALLPGSPAFNRGDPVVFEKSDQRDVLRFAGSSDIGAFEFDAWISVFCTPGTSTNGCTAQISCVGTPSATAASGFTITVSQVDALKQGLIFYGVDNIGFTPLSWGASSHFLCVKLPTQRTPLQNSGGTVWACDGGLALDWNAFRANNVSILGHPFAGGQIVYAQGWFRDSPAPKASALSNALSFVVLP